jgi:phosphocarrier protein HPr
VIHQEDVKIKNKLGLHARAAALFVKTANRFASQVTVQKEKLRVNGKSILGVLTLAAAFGSDIRIICEGPDSEEALEALKNLVDLKFQEE